MSLVLLLFYSLFLLSAHRDSTVDVGQDVVGCRDQDLVDHLDRGTQRGELESPGLLASQPVPFTL